MMRMFWVGCKYSVVVVFYRSLHLPHGFQEDLHVRERAEQQTDNSMQQTISAL